MGQSKGGGYKKMPTLLPEQMTMLQNLLSQVGGFQNQAAQGYQQFLPGGGGGEAIKEQAMRDFQQKTVPSIMGAFGTDAKSSSALNQALAQGGADLNTNLASMLSQLQLSASQGLGEMGQRGAQLGLGTPGFSYLQRQPPLWQQLLGPLISGGSQIGAAYLGGV